MSFTPTPAGKWTPSSLLKLNDQIWSIFLKDTLLDGTISKEEKNKRIDKLLPFAKAVHEQCINGDIHFKSDRQQT